MQIFCPPPSQWRHSRTPLRLPFFRRRECAGQGRSLWRNGHPFLRDPGGARAASSPLFLRTAIQAPWWRKTRTCPFREEVRRGERPFLDFCRPRRGCHRELAMLIAAAIPSRVAAWRNSRAAQSRAVVVARAHRNAQKVASPSLDSAPEWRPRSSQHQPASGPQRSGDPDLLFSCAPPVLMRPLAGVVPPWGPGRMSPGLLREIDRVRDFSVFDVALDFIDTTLHFLTRALALLLHLPLLPGLFRKQSKDLQFRKLQRRALRRRFRFPEMFLRNEAANLLLAILLLLALLLVSYLAPRVPDKFLQFELFRILAEECISLVHGFAKSAVAQKSPQLGQLLAIADVSLFFLFAVEHQHLQIGHGGVLRMRFCECVNDFSCPRKFLLSEKLPHFAKLPLFLQILKIVTGHLLQLDQFGFTRKLPEPLGKNLQTLFVVQCRPQGSCLMQYFTQLLALLPAGPIFFDQPPKFLPLGVGAVHIERLSKSGGCFRERSFRQSLFCKPQLLLHLLGPGCSGLHFGEQTLRGLEPRVQAERRVHFRPSLAQFSRAQEAAAAIQMFVDLGQ